MEAYAVCPPGAEALIAAELGGLGLAPRKPERGGVPFEAEARALYEAALGLRTASRILVRLAEFQVRSFAALERHARRIPWDRFSRPGDPIQFRVTSTRSRLYHERAVAARLSDAARAAGRDVVEGRPEHRPDRLQRIVVRLFRDRCTVSVDATGFHLHRRGYRRATAKAPLRENLAAAVLLAAGWDAATSLVDPLCGSGTLVIEAALLALRRAPGLGRGFAFQDWPNFDAELWEAARRRAMDGSLASTSVALVGSDRDAGAVRAARENAERAGVAGAVAFEERSLSGCVAPEGPPGFLVTNPPWGRRIGESDRLRDLYAALGNVARERFAGWTLVVVSPDARLVGHTGLALQRCAEVPQGGVRVRVWKGAVP